MPHVKGNKFKPAPPAAPADEPAVVAAPVLEDAAGVSKPDKKKQRTKDRHRQQQQQQAEAAIPANSSHSSKQQLRAGDAAVQQLARKKRKLAAQDGAAAAAAPVIPTVIVPPPKVGKPSVAAATSNWAALQATIAAGKLQKRPHKHYQPQTAGGTEAAVPGRRPGCAGSNSAPTKVVALDCEMVGTGPGGQTSVLARVCLVNSAGNVLLDTFVRPRERVTDFRTKVSGVRPADLKGAPPFKEVQMKVEALLRGRILVGHMLENDLAVLLLSHPRKDTRDTGAYPPLMRVQGMTGKLKPRALRHLALEQLGLQIQAGEHSPVDDARAALYLYQKHRKEWERWLQQGGKAGRGSAAAAPSGAGGGHGCVQGMKQTLEHLAAKAAYMNDL